MSNPRPSNENRNMKQLVILGIGAVAAVILVCIVLASMITRQWPWQKDNTFNDYTGRPTNAVLDTEQREEPSDTTTATETTAPTQVPEETTEATTAPTETTEATTAPTETTPAPTTKPKPKPTDPTTEPTEGSAPTTGGNNEDIEYDELSPTTPPTTEPLPPSPQLPETDTEIDVPLD